MEKYKDLINKINNYSHAYIINTNNLDEVIGDAKYLAKSIINENNDGKVYSNDEINDLIDNETFDDFYILKNDNLIIKVDEINNLMNYFNTKSLRANGRRVYIIVGVEKIINDNINKLLKFIEEPYEDLYCILLTKEIDKILPTILSRCQRLNFTYDNVIDDYELSIKFFDFFNKYHLDTLAYVKEIFDEDFNKESFYKFLNNNEVIINNLIHQKENVAFDKNLIVNNFDYNINYLINMLEVTIKIKSLVKYNLNLNLLIDRYIIELNGGYNE